MTKPKKPTKRRKGQSASKASKAMLDAVRSSMMKDQLIRQFTEQDFWSAHHVDIVWRINGEDKRFEADWIKDIWYILKASNPYPAHRKRRRNSVGDIDIVMAEEREGGAEACASELKDVVSCCGWVIDHDGEAWDTGCGQVFVINDGTPKENGILFCPYCGRKIDS